MAVSVTYHRYTRLSRQALSPLNMRHVSLGGGSSALMPRSDRGGGAGLAGDRHERLQRPRSPAMTCNKPGCDYKVEAGSVCGWYLEAKATLARSHFSSRSRGGWPSPRVPPICAGEWESCTPRNDRHTGLLTPAPAVGALASPAAGACRTQRGGACSQPSLLLWRALLAYHVIIQPWVSTCLISCRPTNAGEVPAHLRPGTLPPLSVVCTGCTSSSDCWAPLAIDGACRPAKTPGKSNS